MLPTLINLMVSKTLSETNRANYLMAQLSLDVHQSNKLSLYAVLHNWQIIEMHTTAVKTILIDLHTR